MPNRYGGGGLASRRRPPSAAQCSGIAEEWWLVMRQSWPFHAQVSIARGHRTAVFELEGVQPAGDGIVATDAHRPAVDAAHRSRFP